MHGQFRSFLVLAIVFLAVCVSAKEAKNLKAQDGKEAKAFKQALKKGKSVGLSKKGSIRAAYDDGLEESPEDEESSARSNGLEDTVVRTSVVRAAQIIADASKRGWNVLQSLTGKSKTDEEIPTEPVEASKESKLETSTKASSTEMSNASETTVSTPPPDQTSKANSETSGKNEGVSTTFATSATTTPEPEYVKVGDDKFEGQYVQEVGDLDGNGVTDIIVHTPLENYSTGAVRVYMMEKGGAVKSSRHLVPGKWGFEVKGGLKQGDRFGAAVHELGDLNGDGIKDIAVTAPGESKTSGQGSIFVLLLNADGSVRETRLLDEVNEEVKKIAPCEEKKGEESDFVQMRERIMRLFDFENSRDGAVSSASESILSESVSSESVSTAENAVKTSEKAVVGDCYFSDTHCQCLKVSSASMCLDFLETLGDGRSVCTERNCQDSYKCSCDENAKEFCARSTGSRQVYAKVGPLPDGRIECKQEESTLEVAEVLPGAAVPAQKPLGSSSTGVGTWTDTECACTPKGTLTDPGKCPQFDHMKDGNTYCVPNACKMSEKDMVCDIEGKSLCSRKKIQKAIFVDDGAADTPAYIRCHEETVEREIVECTSNCP